MRFKRLLARASMGFVTTTLRQLKLTRFLREKTSNIERPQHPTLQFRTATTGDPASTWTCGSCRYLKEPILLSRQFVETCRALFSSNEDFISLDILSLLIQEAIRLNRSNQKCSCRKAGTPGPYGWIHLLDTACYAWEPRRELETSISQRCT